MRNFPDMERKGAAGQNMMLEKLNYLRRRDRLTAEQIAHDAEIPLSTLNKILTGVTKRPTLHAMGRLAEIFKVPLQYLFDDTIPIDCSLCTFAAHEQLTFISERELCLVTKYRALELCAKETVDILVNQLDMYARVPDPAAAERVLLCCIAPARGEQGSYADGFLYQSIAATLPPALAEADLAIQVSSHALEPVYPQGTILALKSGRVQHDQLGAFVLNNEGFIRRLCSKKDVKKLVSINVGARPIVVREQDTLLTMGRVLGAVRTYRWL